MTIFERLESEVRGYCRNWPVLFARARGSEMFDDSGRRYIDFFAGAGVLNYGHNHPRLKAALTDYLSGDSIVHSLDMMTVAKQRFLEALERRVLRPRDLSYKVQFPGPTGTNAVEAALKLARKATGRQTVAAFTNAFHGMTLGALACTGNHSKRAGAGVGLPDIIRLPFAGAMGDASSLDYMRSLLINPSSGIDAPAAVIVETVQAEGGVHVSSLSWLRELRALTAEHGILLIVDDIQVGCGRTGPFFSFEKADIEPDIVCLSKSLSGLGLPLSVVLIKPELDVWAPGEHNGTFRGHNPAFVTATAALEQFWAGDDQLSADVVTKAAMMRERLLDLAQRAPRRLGEVRGRGMIMGLECKGDLAPRIAKAAFERGLIIETAGANDEVVKLLPALTIEPELLDEGLRVLEDTIASTSRNSRSCGSLPRDATCPPA